MEVLQETEKLKLLTHYLIQVAKKSKCKRSKCGSIIVSGGGAIISEGWNSKPGDEGGECFKDNLSPTFKSDRTCCVHAEQRAIMDALKSPGRVLIPGSTIYFVRLD